MRTVLRKFPDKIVPGYYINKEHWHSVYLDSDVPEETVRRMIDMSYKLALDSLRKVKREKTLSGS